MEGHINLYVPHIFPRGAACFLYIHFIKIGIVIKSRFYACLRKGFSFFVKIAHHHNTFMGNIFVDGKSGMLFEEAAEMTFIQKKMLGYIVYA